MDSHSIAEIATDNSLFIKKIRPEGRMTNVLFMLKRYLLFLLILLADRRGFAHPMPSSIIYLSVLDSYISGEARIPLVELNSAVGSQRITNINDLLFKSYFFKHIRAFSKGKKWDTDIANIYIVTVSASTRRLSLTHLNRG